MLIIFRSKRYHVLDPQQHLWSCSSAGHEACEECSSPQPLGKLIAGNEPSTRRGTAVLLVTGLGQDWNSTIADEQRTDEVSHSRRGPDAATDMAATTAPRSASSFVARCSDLYR